MRNLKITLIIFLMLLLISNPATAISNKYKDVPSTFWAFNAIQKLSQDGVVRGFPDNSFKPNQKITREHFAIILVNYFKFKLNEKASRTFWDIDYNHRSFQYIDAAKSFIPVHNKIGFSFYFQPAVAITREDAANAIVLALNLNAAQQPPQYYLAAKFSDYQNISPELSDNVAIAIYYGILAGDTKRNFNPKAGLSRAEICAVINNVTQNQAKIKAGFKPARKPWTIQFVNFKRPDYEMVRDFPGYKKMQTFYGKITSKVTGFNNSYFVVTHQIIENENIMTEEKTVRIYVADKDLNLFKVGDWVFFHYDRDNNVTSYEE